MKLLVGYKGKNVGRDLLKLAAERILAHGGEVYIITSLFGGEKTSQEQIRTAEENLESARKFLVEKGVTCETHLLIRGCTTGEDIVLFAEENGIDEIMIGVKSRSKVGKLLFGSTAQFVILKAGCPVTSVK